MISALTRCVFILVAAILVVSCTRTSGGPADPGFDPLVVTTTMLADAEAGSVYDASLGASGGDGVYLWSLAAGSLPDGLALSSDGSISGTPSTEGGFDFTVSVTSGDGQTAGVSLSISVTAPGPLAPSEVCAANPPEAVVSFADAGLEERVRAALGVAAGTPITCSQAASVTTLTADGRGITSLTGIQNLTGLTSAVLHENDITDIAPLADLTSLTTVNLYSNPISDLGPLSGLLALDVLVLWDVPATDLSPLSSLTTLTFLEYWGNPTPVTDIDALAPLTSLVRLFLEGNAIENLDALSGMTALRDLDLDDNQLTDIGALAGLTELTSVWLSGNPALADIGALLNNPGLGSGDGVDLRGTAVSCTDVAALQAKGVNVSSDC